MKRTLPVTVAAALVATSGAVAPTLASAHPRFKTIKKADEKKNPTATDVALTQAEAADAKRQAHYAKKQAKVAAHQAKTAARDIRKTETGAG